MNRHGIALPHPSQTSIAASFRRLSRSAASAFCALAGLALFCLFSAAPAPAQVAESVVPLSEHTPQQILDGTATRIGHYNSAQKLRLTLSIKPPHMAEEEEFLRELTDRTSPNFHQFLTPEEWNARFGPSAQDEQAVVDWAVSQGLTVTHRFNHRLLVDVEAPVSVIEKAFGVTVNQYQYRGEVDFSNDRDPAIPGHLQGILYNIQGLNSIQHDHGSRPGTQAKVPNYAEGPAYAEGPSGQADAKATRPTSAATSNDVSNSTLFTNGYMNPTEVFSSQVYNYDGLQNLGHCCNPHNDSGGTPNVSNIAIAAFGNFNGSDVTGFQAAYPYLAYNYQTHFIDGSIDCTSDPNDCPSGETTQDVEWTIATANSFGSSNATAKIFPYIGANYNNNTFTDMYGFMLSDNLARVFTTSWSCTEVYGCPTSTMDARHSIFNSMVGQGWTLIAASGDRGSSDDCYLDKSTNTYNTAHESAAYPGSDYDVLAAGGTKIMVYNDGSWDYEHAWEGGTNYGDCGHNNGGSGGGVSSYYAKQGWQNFLGGTKRQTPDISLNALGIGQNLYINGNLQCCANGTSIVAPELAGFFAQENAYLNYIGHVCGSGGTSSCTPVGNPMWFFYPPAHYGAGYVSHFPFYDMTGNYCNSNDVTAAQSLGSYCTGAGWDNVTGWGSDNMLQLAWAINWYLIPSTDSTPSVNWSGPTTSKWYNTDQQISWTIQDGSGSTTPSSGIAGFTQGWDSMPPDSFSKPHGGTGDTFWSGPQYPNYTNGCMTLVGNPTCPGGVSQGCHTAHVRGWNNQGWTTGEQTYGPICYDTVAPTIAIGTNLVTDYNTWVNKSVIVTLTSSDSGGSAASGIYKTYYAFDTSLCYPGHLAPCSVYAGPFTTSTLGRHYIYAFTVDNAGNSSTEPYQWISIDETAPATTASLSGTVYSGSTYETAVKVTLNPSDTGGSGVLHTYYEIDGGSQSTYSGSAFTVSALGSHSVKYWSVDAAGNTETAKINTFSISSPTTAALVATPNPSLLGQPVTMTATVTATLSGTPTGSVTFWNGATNLGTGTLSAGMASLTTSALPAGNLTLQVSYAGAGNFLATNSAPFDQTVDSKAVLTSPAPGITLTGTSATFSWTAGVGDTKYEFRLGTTGPGSRDVYNAAEATTTALTTGVVSGIPATGATLYARIYSYINGVWQHNDYTYIESGTPVPAVLTSPTPGSTLTGTSATFSWSAGSGVTKYEFRLGTTGHGSSDVYNASGASTTALTTGAIPVPAYGVTLYARIYSYINGAWQYNDYTYLESGTPVKAVLTSPTPGITLTGSSATFTWTAGGGVTKYLFELGTTGHGSSNVYNAAGTSTTALTTGVVSGIPTTGATLYARLYSYINGAWQYNDYTYTEQ